MRFATKQIHAGVEPDPTTGSILTPIYQSTTYVQESVDRYLEKGYSYSRSGNPTVQALDKKLAELERRIDEAKRMKEVLEIVTGCECPTFADCARATRD